MGSGTLSATLRWGKMPSDTKEYPVSDDGQSIFIYDEDVDGAGVWGPELLVISADASPYNTLGAFLDVRIAPPGANPITAKFNIKGFDAAYAPVGKQCHLSPAEALGTKN